MVTPHLHVYSSNSSKSRCVTHLQSKVYSLNFCSGRCSLNHGPCKNAAHYKSKNNITESLPARHWTEMMLSPFPQAINHIPFSNHIKLYWYYRESSKKDDLAKCILWGWTGLSGNPGSRLIANTSFRGSGWCFSRFTMTRSSAVLEAFPQDWPHSGWHRQDRDDHEALNHKTTTMKCYQKTEGKIRSSVLFLWCTQMWF